MLAKKSTSAERMEKMREMLAECKANTTTLKKADGCSMFYSNIDFLTIKLTDGTELVNTLRGLSENSPNYECDNGLFKIQYEGMVMSGQLTVLRVYDKPGNKVGCVHLRNENYITVIPAEYDPDTGEVIKSAETRKASNKNVCTDLELTGDFWKMYSDYFDYFCQIFSVDKTRTKSVSRMDVCMDIAGLDTNDAFNRFRKKIDEGEGGKGQGFYIGNTLAGWTDKSDRFEMAIYNKKLDIIEKNKQKICSFDSEFPYLSYIRQEFPITRFEVRFSARVLREAEASIDYCFKYGKQIFVDYVRRFYNLCLEDFWGDDFTKIPRSEFPKKEDKFVSAIIGKKAQYSQNMMTAYANNLRDYKNEAYVFKCLYDMYGDRLRDWLFKNHGFGEFDLLKEAQMIF